MCREGSIYNRFTVQRLVIISLAYCLASNSNNHHDTFMSSLRHEVFRYRHNLHHKFFMLA